MSVAIDMASGVKRFARYAYPPNELGLCGPDDSGALLEYAASGVVDRGLVELAHGFHGAWPYLELLAGTGGIVDPLDARVVEAYWIGSPLSDAVRVADLGNHLDQRFRQRAGAHWDRVVDAITGGAGVCHQFHVFEVYPWVGLLRSGARDHAVRVLDRCRIRVGRVLEIDGESAVVRSQPLRWDGTDLALAPPIEEVVQLSRNGYRLGGEVAAGDTVSLHWDWVCEPISPAQEAQLHVRTAWHLRRAGLLAGGLVGSGS
jgi:hypothetical protein